MKQHEHDKNVKKEPTPVEGKKPHGKSRMKTHKAIVLLVLSLASPQARASEGTTTSATNSGNGSQYIIQVENAEGKCLPSMGRVHHGGGS
jgi:hypothetical protein